MTEKFFIRTFGCQMNEHDSERIAGGLAVEGLERTESLEDADVVVLNTCCIRENADNKLYGNLGHLKSLKDGRPGFKIVVAGCLAQKDKQLVAERAPYVDLVVGTFNATRVGKLLSEVRDSRTLVEIWDGPKPEEMDFSPLMAQRESNHSAWVSIQTGCNNGCAFCIVPSVRGREVSRPFGDLIQEVTRLAGAGVTEVTLLGQNVNSYGRDITLDLRQGRLIGDPTYLAGESWVASGGSRPVPLFADLLRGIGAVDGIRRVRFTSPHPKDIRPETLLAMQEVPEVCEHLHFPLQSGSDRILAMMHRGYDSRRYLASLQAARDAIEDLAVTTDIIVGFPGETEQDFENTLEVASQAEFDGAFTFIFSPRPGTEAAQMSDRMVDEDTIAARFEQLKIVIDRSTFQRNRDRVGRVEEVMVEGPSKRDESAWSGRTRQNRLVHFPKPTTGVGSDQLVYGPGSYVSIAIDYAAPHFVKGKVLELIHKAPRPRQRLTVTAS